MADQPQPETRPRQPPDRYEFRVWGDDLSMLLARLRAVGDGTQSQESSEVYIVSHLESAFNAKIRDGRLDVKQLVATCRDLELWRPYLKERFPIRSHSLRDELCQILCLRRQFAWTATETPDTFLGELVESCPHLTVVPLRKKRYRFALGPCLAEFVAVAADRIRRESVCVESEDAATASRGVAHLGLSGQDNWNYQTALRAMLGIDGMTRANASA